MERFDEWLAALRLERSLDVLLMPIRSRASRMIAAKMSGVSALIPGLDHDLTWALCSSLAVAAGKIETAMLSCVLLLNVIWVAKRVHSSPSRGKGIFVRPSRTELFPLDWSPTTTSCGRLTYSPTPQVTSLSIFSSRPRSENFPVVDFVMVKNVNFELG